jgi:predicted acyl esterase
LVDIAIERNVMVQARDGVRLATDVYRPARGGKTNRVPVPGCAKADPLYQGVIGL